MFCKYFYPFYKMSFPVPMVCSVTQIFEFWYSPILSVFSFLDGRSKKLLLIPDHKDLCLFSFLSFLVLAFTFFRSLIPLKFIFAYGVRKASSIGISYGYRIVWGPFFKKRMLFSFWIFFASLWKINWHISKDNSLDKGEEVLYTSVFGEQFGHACLKWKYQKSAGHKC